MRKFIVLITCLFFILCGCSSSQEIEPTETTDILQNYEDTFFRNIKGKIPADSSHYVIVSEKEGFYHLSFSIVNSKDDSKFLDYVFSVKDAFEQTFPEECLGGFSVTLVGSENSYRINFTSSSYEENSSEFYGMIFDSRIEDSSIHWVKNEEELREFLSSSNSEVTKSEYIINTSSNVFHYTWCNSAEKIKISNRKTFIGAREELIENGYKSCNNCNP